MKTVKISLENLTVDIPVIKNENDEWFCPDGDYIKIAREKMAEKILNEGLHFVVDTLKEE